MYYRPAWCNQECRGLGSSGHGFKSLLKYMLLMAGCTCMYTCGIDLTIFIFPTSLISCFYSFSWKLHWKNRLGLLQRLTAFLTTGLLKLCHGWVQLWQQYHVLQQWQPLQRFLSTVTTTTSSTVMSTQCPLTWFATVTEKQSRLDSSWTRSEHDTKNGELSREMEDVESACPATCMEIQSSCSSATKNRSPLSIQGARQTEKFSLQTQTPQNLVVSIFVRPALKMCLFVVYRPVIFILVTRVTVRHHKAFREMPKLSRVTEFSIHTEQSLYGCILFLRHFHLKLYVRYCIKITLRHIHFVQEVFGLFPTYNGDFEMVGGKRRQNWRHDGHTGTLTSCTRS